jgi:hypothetical protein
MLRLLLLPSPLEGEGLGVRGHFTRGPDRAWTTLLSFSSAKAASIRLKINSTISGSELAVFSLQRANSDDSQRFVALPDCDFCQYDRMLHNQTRIAPARL